MLHLLWALCFLLCIDDSLPFTGQNVIAGSFNLVTIISLCVRIINALAVSGIKKDTVQLVISTTSLSVHWVFKQTMFVQCNVLCKNSGSRCGDRELCLYTHNTKSTGFSAHIQNKRTCSLGLFSLFCSVYFLLYSALTSPLVSFSLGSATYWEKRWL